MMFIYYIFPTGEQHFLRPDLHGSVDFTHEEPSGDESAH